MDDNGPSAEHVPDDERMPAWYTTRILLAIGIGAALLAGGLLAFEPTFTIGRPRMWQDPLVLAGCLGIAVGLVRVIRIYRGPRDEPPPWRYRDR